MRLLYDATFAIINMKIHILGIGGTFMAGIAIIAKQLGHDVSGSELRPSHCRRAGSGHLPRAPEGMHRGPATLADRRLRDLAELVSS